VVNGFAFQLRRARVLASPGEAKKYLVIPDLSRNPELFFPARNADFPLPPRGGGAGERGNSLKNNDKRKFIPPAEESRSFV
jgi:hypothetical protein